MFYCCWMKSVALELRKDFLSMPKLEMEREGRKEGEQKGKKLIVF